MFWASDAMLPYIAQHLIHINVIVDFWGHFANGSRSAATAGLGASDYRKKGEIMSDIIQQLREDHVNVSKLLDVLDGQMRIFHEGGTPDYVLMQDAMHYMIHYPDLIHHPKEDLVFKKLTEHDPSAQPVVNNLIKEHKVLAEKGTQFFESLKVVESESMMSRESLQSQGQDYVAFLRSHIQKEEDQVFPLAAKALRDEDWEEIDVAMEKKEDPVFGKLVAEEYRALYDFLVQQDE